MLALYALRAPRLRARARRSSPPSLLAFHAGAVDTGGDVQSEALYLALFLAAVAALWRAR